eukprot:1158968-Pelagomonas_calceolata.AAC.1
MAAMQHNTSLLFGSDSATRAAKLQGATGAALIVAYARCRTCTQLHAATQAEPGTPKSPSNESSKDTYKCTHTHTNTHTYTLARTHARKHMLASTHHAALHITAQAVPCQQFLGVKLHLPQDVSQC